MRADNGVDDTASTTDGDIFRGANRDRISAASESPLPFAGLGRLDARDRDVDLLRSLREMAAPAVALLFFFHGLAAASLRCILRHVAYLMYRCGASRRDAARRRGPARSRRARGAI